MSQKYSVLRQRKKFVIAFFLRLRCVMYSKIIIYNLPVVSLLVNTPSTNLTNLLFIILLVMTLLVITNTKYIFLDILNKDNFFFWNFNLTKKNYATQTKWLTVFYSVGALRGSACNELYTGRSGYGTRTQLTAVCIQKSYEFCFSFVQQLRSFIPAIMWIKYSTYTYRNIFVVYELCDIWGRIQK